MKYKKPNPDARGDLSDLPDQVFKIRSHYYQQKTPIWYNGYHHIAFTAIFCIASLAISFWLLDQWLWYLPLVFLASFSFTAVKEYFLHRYPLHQKIKGFYRIVKEHAGQHHGYFTHDAMEARSHLDFFRVLFQPQDILVFVGFMNLPIAVFLGYQFGSVVGIMHYVAGVIYFALYEILHFIYHSSPTAIWHRIPVLKGMIEHHTIHHNKKLMAKYNFGVVLPVMDRIFNTHYQKESK